MRLLSWLSWRLLERLSTQRRDEVQKRGEERREGAGRRVDLKGLDGGLECVAGEGALSLASRSLPLFFK